jgi:hypothetical protein
MFAMALLSVQVTAARQAVPSQPSARYVILFGFGGEFVKLDTSTAVVVERGAVARIEGVAAHLSSQLPADANSAEPWLAHEVVSDIGQERLYLAVPRMGADGQEFIVLSVSVPVFKLQGVISVTARPTLVLDRDHRRLLVSYVDPADANRVIGRLNVHDTVDLSRLHTFSHETTVARFERGEETPASLLSPGASMAPGGNVIVDGLRKITVSSEKLAVESINVASLLTSSQQQTLAPFYQRDQASGQQWLPYSFAGSAGGRAVFIVASPQSREMALLTVDAIAARVIAVAVVPIGHVRITSDGAVAIVDCIERRTGPKSTAASPIEKPGRLVRIDLGTGTSIDEVVDPSLAGGIDHGVVCVGSANDPVVYAAGDSLKIIRFGDAPQVTSSETTFRSALRAKCGWSVR